MGVTDHYNKLYSENNNPFGEIPVPLAEVLAEHLKTGGTVIEFGAGDGRNSLYLAAQGFKVTAVDISSVAIEKINSKALSDGLTLETKILDIRQLDSLATNYDAIVSIFVVHHLNISEALSFISLMQEHTNKGGFNLISAFTKTGDFYKENPESGRFYADHNQLPEFYSDWEIIDYYEKESNAFAKHPDGSNMKNVAASLLARK